MGLKNILLLLTTLLGTAFAVGQTLQPFALPTQNRDILNPITYTNYFIPTVMGDWSSGTFGCVRSSGNQLHEGLDIRSHTRDKKGEATDPVLCTAPGTVVHLCSNPANSNYGRYIVVQHNIDGIEIYSLYAHLGSIAPGITNNTPVQQGTPLGIIGRSTNTKERISQARAHLHFELSLYLNPYFTQWFDENYPNQIHQNGFHGWNLAGLDPWEIIKAEQKGKFNLADFIRRDQEELCRVLIHKKTFSFAYRYPRLVLINQPGEQEGIVAWEVFFNYNGVPYRIIPRSSSEIKGKTTGTYTLLHVNEAEQSKNPARHFLTVSNGKWKLTNKFISYLDQITYYPTPTTKKQASTKSHTQTSKTRSPKKKTGKK